MHPSLGSRSPDLYFVKRIICWAPAYEIPLAIHSVVKSVLMLLCNCLQHGMILDWKLCLLSTLKVVSKKARGKKHTAFYSMLGEHKDRAIFQIPCVIIWCKLSASQLMGKLCFCFGLFWVFLTTSKLVTVLGNKKRELLTPLCGMWQQEPVSASRKQTAQVILLL